MTETGCVLDQPLGWSLATVAHDDAELARAAARGNEDAFVRLVAGHRGFIYSLAYRVVLNIEDALDVTQTVMLRLVEKIGKYDGRGAFKSSLATMVTREAINHLRRPSRREDVVDPEILVEVCDDGRTTGEEARGAVLQAQRMAAIEHALVHLSPQQRAIMTLRLLSELGPKEIAEQMGLPARQVRSQIHRAVERLRWLLRGKL